jgi:hypothetical protein
MFCILKTLVSKNHINNKVLIPQHSKGRGWKAQLLKSAAAEAIYNIWKYRNDICFGNQIHNTNIEDGIINIIVYRGWMYPKLRGPLSSVTLA